MKIDLISQLSDQFLSLAAKEKLPPKTNDLNTLLSNLSSLETFQARLIYAKKNLTKISSGSSRTVFELPNNQVLKLASNEKGIFQNAAEAQVKFDTQYINPTTQQCPNYSWVIAPRADKITEKEFKELTNLNFKDFSEAVRLKVANQPINKIEKKYQPLYDLPMVNQIASLAKKYKLMTGDIARISSWGKKDSTPVLIDLGLNRKIYKKFYASQKSQRQMSKQPSVAE